jgi:CD2 antigen cytoplasmic tail-binding protein 2
MKRRIANVLEPEETILQCLRRLKGSGNRKAKMFDETKIVFDQLTEDAMKLMENGEYDVYHEKKDVFEREVRGYEEIARAR